MEANATGDDPLNVTFQLNATDADGDRLSWVLEFGDGNATNGTFQRKAAIDAAIRPNGTTNATEVVHLYALAGQYNATLRVSDGNAATNVTLILNLTAGISFTQFVAEGTPDLPCPQCTQAGANTGAGYRAGVNELDSFFAEVPEDAAGQPFTVDSTGGDANVSFRTSCGSGGTAVELFANAGPESGTVPEGALCALMWEDSTPASTITLTIG